LGQTAGIVELDQVSNGSDIQAYLAQRTGASRVTVPQVKSSILFLLPRNQSGGVSILLF
jgi:hypothetical protein